MCITGIFPYFFFLIRQLLHVFDLLVLATICCFPSTQSESEERFHEIFQFLHSFQTTVVLSFQQFPVLLKFIFNLFDIDNLVDSFFITI